MSREVRMVPADWQHPRYPEGHHFAGRYIPLLKGSYAERAEEWDYARARWQEGLKESYGDGDKWVAVDPEYRNWRYTDYAGERPSPDDYMPDWPAEQRTHLMMYESTSEGTPLSPAFLTPEELARYLADSRASAFGSDTATYEQWLETCKRGWAMSAIAEPGKGLRSGVAAMADAP